MRIFLDIETLPAHDWDEFQRAEYVRSKVPKTTTKPDSIQAWCVENGEETFRKTSFDYRYGYIHCVCVIFEGSYLEKEDPINFAAELKIYPSDDLGGSLYDQEARVLKVLEFNLKKHITAAHRLPTFIGWNSDKFDFPWLWHAALKHGRKDLAKMLVPVAQDKWKKNWLDLMKVYCCHEFGERAKQAEAAKFLGIEEEFPGLDGSMVYDQWLGGVDFVPAEANPRSPRLLIGDHCISDVRTLQKIAGRIL